MPRILLRINVKTMAHQNESWKRLSLYNDQISFKEISPSNVTCPLQLLPREWNTLLKRCHQWLFWGNHLLLTQRIYLLYLSLNCIMHGTVFTLQKKNRGWDSYHSSLTNLFVNNTLSHFGVLLLVLFSGNRQDKRLDRRVKKLNNENKLTKNEHQD